MPRMWTESELGAIATAAAAGSAAERRRLGAFLADNPPDNSCNAAICTKWLATKTAVQSLPNALTGPQT